MSTWKALALGLVALTACSDDDGEVGETGITEETGVSVEAVCTEPTPVSCVDAIIADLSLQDDLVSEGAVTNTTDGEDFVTSVDATAGGFQNAANNPWVYIRFTESGAERVDLDDETALESMDWHVAAKRYNIRVNSGSSGPSCVAAATMLDTEYASIGEVPSGLQYFEDDFYTPDCTLINDSSGLPGNPQTALGAWWSYPGCVATSGTPFILQLDDGHIVKLVVEAYYGEGQEGCNESGTPGSESARLTWRWTYLQ